MKSIVGDAVILDGDDMRESISIEGFSREDRHAHNLRVARLAQVLAKQSPVIVAVIAPFADTRREITKIICPRWVLCSRRDQKDGREFPYELPDPDEIDFAADGDARTPMENALLAVKVMRTREAKQSC